MISEFVSVNQRLSMRLRPVPKDADEFYSGYASVVATAVSDYSHPTVLDVGGGAVCRFAGHVSDCKVIAVDISAEELAKNRDVTDRRVADASKELPFPDSSVEIVTSRMVVEHLPDVSRFVSESARVLKPGGTFIAVFPCGYAPFALVNRIIPNRLTQWLLSRFTRFAHGGGFPAYYDHCSPRQMRKLLQANGFSITTMRCCYFAADYCAFFTPLYLGMSAFEVAAEKMGLSELSACVLVTAVRTADTQSTHSACA